MELARGNVDVKEFKIGRCKILKGFKGEQQDFGGNLFNGESVKMLDNWRDMVK